MHTFDAPAGKPLEDDGRPWWRLMNRYHWFVLGVAALGWMFDCMDQQLFNIARRPAMVALVPADKVNESADYATSIFLLGWGAGGILFGVLGDLIGRARTMMLTILCYSIFTGLSALSTGFWDFGLYRFLTALGVGGQFAVGVALVAEVVPDRARPFALGLLQALSAIGNVTAAGISILLPYLKHVGILESDPWRIMFLVGAVPAVLALLIFRHLKEPERWKATAEQSTLGDRLRAYFATLFEDRRWARHAVLGLVLASAGIIGLWGIGFFSVDLQRIVFETNYRRTGTMSEEDVKYYAGIWTGITSATLNIGAFFGIYAFSRVTHIIGRRPAFAISFLLAMLSTALVFWQFSSTLDVFWMIPLMGFCQLSVFGGYAIYFPELFPTRLRSSGTSFCYNVARFVAAFGLGFKAVITHAFDRYATPEHPEEPLRYAGLVMCAIFLVGILVLPFLPETRGKPLPE